MSVSELLTIQDVAMLLKVSRQHVRKMICAGPLPAVKIGREWRIEKDYLKNFLEENMV